MLTYTLIAVAVIIVAFVIVVAMQPDEYRVVRSASITAPPPAVFVHVNDFHKWVTWSPWQKMDPSAKTTYEGSPAGEGAVYTWTGNSKVGQGKMTITDSKPSEVIRIRLDFIKPFTGVGNAEFKFEPKGNATEVTWTMVGKKVFITKAIGLFVTMDKMIGGSFEQGLSAMKSEVESKG